MHKHKQKHIADVKSMQSGTRHGWQSTNKADFGVPAGSLAFGGQTPEGHNFTSQRELQYCKRFNTVNLRPQQELNLDTEVPERPWPRPGGGLASGRAGSEAS